MRMQPYQLGSPERLGASRPDEIETRFNSRRNLPVAFMKGLGLLRKEAETGRRPESIAEIELYQMFINAMTRYRPDLFIDRLRSPFGHEFAPRACLDFPRYDKYHQVRRHRSGKLDTFHIDLKIPLPFIGSALARNGDCEAASALIDNSTNQTPILPEQLDNAAISFSNRLFERRNRGDDTNWKESRRVWMDLAKGRAYRLSPVL